MLKTKNKILIGITIGILLSKIIVSAESSYESKNIYYNNTNSNLHSSNVKGALDELAEKYAGGTECPNGYLCVEKKTTLALGDYISLTPTKSSYTTDINMTGYTSTQTINPQELNLWRVIRFNSNGTVDIISEYVSSIAIYFSGLTGYKNFIGYLNVLASQYENSDYTIGSRYFGYNGQTEYITDTSMFKNPAPWTASTGSTTVESKGGGDKLYTTDYDLVNNVLGRVIATKPNGTAENYWMASRHYGYQSSNYYWWSARYVNSKNSNNYYGLYYYKDGSFNKYNSPGALRPILTLKAGLKYSGLGIKVSPMQIGK